MGKLDFYHEKILIFLEEKKSSSKMFTDLAVSSAFQFIPM